MKALYVDITHRIIRVCLCVELIQVYLLYLGELSSVLVVTPVRVLPLHPINVHHVYVYTLQQRAVFSDLILPVLLSYYL